MNRSIEELEDSNKTTAAMIVFETFLEQDGPQDANAGEGGAQFRLFERSELRNCRRSQHLQGARKSWLKYSYAAVPTETPNPMFGHP